MLRIIILVLLFTTQLIAQGSVGPFEQLCKKEKLGRNDPKSNDIEGRNGDPCANDTVEALVVNPSCHGGADGSISLIVTGMRPPLTYHWITGAMGPLLNSLGAGLYSVVVTDADGCTKSLTVLLLEPTELSIGVEVGESSATATALGGNGGYAYAWSNGTTGATASSLAPGNYGVTVTDSKGCVATAAATVDDPAAPSLLTARAGPDQIGCAGDDFRLGADQVAFGGIPPYTYSWSGPGSLTTPASANPFAAPLTTGIFTYTVLVTDASGATATDQVSVTVNPRPSPSLSAASSEVCTGDAPVALTASPGGGVLTGAGVSAGFFDPALAGPGEHTLSYTVSDNGCSAFTTTTVRVLPTVAADWLLPPGPLFLCSDAFFPAALVTGTPGGVFSGALIDVDGSLNPGLAAGAGSFPITYTVGEGGCAASRTLTVELFELSTLSIIPATVTNCAFPLPLVGQLQPGPVAGGTFGGGVYVNDRGEFDPTGLAPGNYPITYTYGAGACQTSIFGTVEVQASNLAAGFNLVQDGTAIFLTDQSSDAQEYHYEFGDGTSSDEAAPVHAFAQAGLYEVCQTVRDACTSQTSCQQVVVTLPNGSVAVNVRVFLGGNYDLAQNLMTDHYRELGLLPATEPYTALGYQHKLGGGGEAIDTTLLNRTGPDAPVDYIVVELRHQLDPGLKLASQTGVVQRNGQVTDVQGNPLSFVGLVPDDYFVALHHRNHLPVMTAGPVPLQPLPQQVDFANPGTPTFGQHARMDLGGPFGLWPGDTDGDGQVVYSGAGTDVNGVSTTVFLDPNNGTFSPSFIAAGYFSADLDLDGRVIYAGSGTEVNIISTTVLLHPLNNPGFSSSLPVFGQVPPEQ